LLSTTHEVEKLGLEAAYNRLAGNAKGFEVALARIMDDKKPPPLRLRDPRLRESLMRPKALFLNGRPADALKLLVKAGEHKLAYDVLSAQLKVRQARELVEQARKKKARDLPALEILEAGTLHRLGEKEKGLAVFKRYGDSIKEGTDASWFEDL